MISSADIPEPFESYSGEGPYIFVSYAHADKIPVYQSMREFRDAGVNMWYDEGIQPAGEWVEEIAHAIKKSSMFVVFVSPRSVDSRFVKSEVGYALSENKDILTIYLEDTTLPAGLSLCLQQFQSVFVSEKNWQSKACSCMLDKVNELPKLNEIGANPIVQEVVEIDHGADLWKSWDRVWLTQLKRGLKGFLPIQPRSPSFYKESGVSNRPPTPENKLIPEQPLGAKLPVHPGRGKTRHPLAFDVSINESSQEVNQPVLENHNDFYAGTFSRIPSGKLSIWVPYAEEQRVVEVEHDFWMGQYLITQEVYTQVMGANPSFTDVESDLANQSLPVNNVSWLDAVAFCKALSILSNTQGTLLNGYEYRLPSEVEWEYACRAGTSTAYYFGDDPSELHNHAWFRGNSRKKIHPVGLKNPNPWNLFDMYGNVREWVGNSFVNTLLNDSEQDEFRISRGGGYMKTAIECQSSTRSTNSLYHRFRNLGFRVVLSRLPNT
jgi:formylglycine-generating enzyme required for sulfatase activity